MIQVSPITPPTPLSLNIQLCIFAPYLTNSSYNLCTWLYIASYLVQISWLALSLLFKNLTNNPIASGTLHASASELYTVGICSSFPGFTLIVTVVMETTHQIFLELSLIYSHSSYYPSSQLHLHRGLHVLLTQQASYSYIATLSSCQLQPCIQLAVAIYSCIWLHCKNVV